MGDQYDIVLLLKSNDDGLSLEEIMSMYGKLSTKDGHPITIQPSQTDIHAIGLATLRAVRVLQDDKHDLNSYVQWLLHNGIASSKDIMFRGLHIWIEKSGSTKSNVLETNIRSYKECCFRMETKETIECSCPEPCPYMVHWTQNA